LDQNQPAKSPLHRIDCIKGIAILMVFGIHSSETVLIPTRTLNLEWYSALTANVLARVCVPWFVIISGFLLLGTGKSQSFRDFYTRRLKRLLLPFAFWVGVYVCWRLAHYPDRPSAMGWMKEIVAGPVYYHLWFLYMLFGMYLAAPFLSRMLATLSNREVGLFLAIWFILASLGPWVQWVLKTDIGIPPGVFASYFGYFVFGGWIRTQSAQPTILKYCRWAVTVLLALTIAGSVWICRRDQDFNQVFLVYLAPNIVLLSIASWMWVSTTECGCLTNQTNLCHRLLTVLGRRSFALYACHIMILQTFNGWTPTLSGAYPFRFVIVGTLTLATTFLAMEVASRIPVLGRLTG